MTRNFSSGPKLSRMFEWTKADNAAQWSGCPWIREAVAGSRRRPSRVTYLRATRALAEWLFWRALPFGAPVARERALAAFMARLEASARVRALFLEKQAQIREQITQLQVIENDLNEAIAYLDSCQTYSSDYAPTECGHCDHQGHQKGDAPPLFAGLSKRLSDEKEFDVPVTVLTRDALTPREGN